MVLVDTSVWVRFLAGREPYAQKLDDLIERGDVLGHDFVFGELLAGDNGGRRVLLDAYAYLRQAKTVPHGEVVDFARRRKLLGRGAGWVDLHLLAAALVAGAALWTADERLAGLAGELNVAYQPG